MADICKAIEIEKEYISNIIHNTNTPALIDLLKDCGFNSLDKYFAAKKEYQFLNCGMKIKEILIFLSTYVPAVIKMTLFSLLLRERFQFESVIVN